jgi:hypothetical protein
VSAAQEPDSIDAARAAIAATRTELAETVIELSDRLNPKVQAGRTAHNVAENLKVGAQRTQALTKQAEAKAEGVAKIGLRRARALGRDHERELAAGALLLVALVLWMRRRRRR